MAGEPCCVKHSSQAGLNGGSAAIRSHSIERRAFAILKRHLEEQGRLVEPSDKKAFDLIVDGRYAELKAKGKPFDAFDFFWLSENQYEAALTDPSFVLFLVCGVEGTSQPEVFEIPAERFRAVEPKSERHYYYDKGLTARLLNRDDI